MSEIFGIGGNMLGLMTNLIFWFLIICVVLLGIVLFLYARKRFRYLIPVIEIIDLGAGKVSFTNTKAGWFKKNKALFGLIDYGNDEELRAKSKGGDRKILEVSSIDFQTINKKAGLLCVRKSDDRKILVPISKLSITNMGVLASIPPADFRSAGIDIMNSASKEIHQSLLTEKILLFGGYVFLGIILLVGIFATIQFNQRGMQELTMLWSKLQEGQCINAVNSVPSGAP